MSFIKVIDKIINDNLKLSVHRCTKTGLTLCVLNTPNTIQNVNFVVPTIGHDDKGEPHCLEHLIFRGSTNYPDIGLLDQLANICMTSGTNAYTMTDRTVYTIQCASLEGLKQILPVYLDHIFNPLLSEASFDSEVFSVDETKQPTGVVFSEMESAMTGPYELSYYTLLKTCYASECSYRHNTGGNPKELANLTLQEVKTFHQKYYKLSKIMINIVGNCNIEEIIETLRIYITNYHIRQEEKDRSSPFCDINLIPKPAVEKKVIFYACDLSNDSIYTSIAYRLDNFTKFEYFVAYRILGKYFCEGPASIFYKYIIDCNNSNCANVEFELLAFGEPLLFFVFTDLTETSEHPYFSVIKQLIDKKIELNYDKIKDLIKQELNIYLYKIESEPYKCFVEQMNNWWLHSDNKLLGEGDVTEFIDQGKTLEKLYEKPIDFWYECLNKLDPKNAYQVVAYPSLDIGEIRKKELDQIILEKIKNNEHKKLRQERTKNSTNDLLTHFKALNSFSFANIDDYKQYFIDRLVTYELYNNPFYFYSYSPTHFSNYQSFEIKINPFTNDDINDEIMSTNLLIIYTNLDSIDAETKKLLKTIQSKYSDYSNIEAEIINFLADDKLVKKLSAEFVTGDDDDTNSNENYDRIKEIALYFVLNEFPIGQLCHLLSCCYFDADIKVPIHMNDNNDITQTTITAEEFENKLCKYLMKYECESGDSGCNSIKDWITFKIEYSNENICEALKLLYLSINCTNLSFERVVSIVKKEFIALQEELRRGIPQLAWSILHNEYDYKKASIMNDSMFTQLLLLKVIVYFPKVFCPILQHLVNNVSTTLSNYAQRTNNVLLYLYCNKSYQEATFKCLSNLWPRWIFVPSINYSHAGKLITNSLSTKYFVGNEKQTNIEEKVTDLNKNTTIFKNTFNKNSSIIFKQSNINFMSSKTLNVSHLILKINYPQPLIKLLCDSSGINETDLSDLTSFTLMKNDACLQILNQYYKSTESPFFQKIRDAGGAYGAGLDFDTELCEFILYINDCARLDVAFDVALECIQDAIKNPPTKLQFNQAKSTALFSAIKAYDNSKNVSRILFYNALLGLDFYPKIHSINQITYKNFVAANKICMEALSKFETDIDAKISVIGPLNMVSKICNKNPSDSSDAKFFNSEIKDSHATQIESLLVNTHHTNIISNALQLFNKISIRSTDSDDSEIDDCSIVNDDTDESSS